MTFAIRDNIPFINERAFPWAKLIQPEPMHKSETASALEWWGTRFGPMGFQLMTENGYTISIMWGEGNYCDNRNRRYPDEFLTECPNAEILVWDRQGHDLNTKKLTLTCTHGDPWGWVTPEDALALIERVMQLPSELERVCVCEGECYFMEWDNVDGS